MSVDVIRVGGDVRQQHRRTFLHGASGDALSNLDAHTFRFSRVPDLKTHAQFLRAFIQKKDREDLVIDDPPHQLSDSL